MNRVEEYIYVGQSIEDFFDLSLTLQTIQKDKPVNDFPVCKRKLSKAQTLRYKQLLKNEKFIILDSELGFVINLDLYKSEIDNTYIPLSDNDLKYDKLELIENQSYLHFLWHLQSKTFDIKLDNSSDYIDMAIYKRMNEILEFSNSKKRFVLFRDCDFGQEYGLAYLTASFKVKLGKLFRIELIEL